VIELILKWLLAALFLYAGIIKWWEPWDFADAVAAFHLLPPLGINLVAMMVPAFEICSGLCLVMPRWFRAGCLLLLLLVGTVSVPLLWAGLQGWKIDCGCFGSSWLSFSNPWLALGRNVVLMVLLGWLYRRDWRKNISI
jgi:putative oxidoreductase